MFEDRLDQEIVDGLKAALANERGASRRFLELFIEFDRRRLQEKSPHATLFAYCTRELRLSEGDAYKRIRVLEAARKFSVILRLIQAGSLHISAVAVLQPHLTPANHRALLRKARGMSKRELEALIATLPTYSGPGRCRDTIVLLPSAPRAACAVVSTPDAERPAAGPPASASPQKALAALCLAPSSTPQSTAGASAAAKALQAAPVPPAPAARISFTADQELLAELTRAKEILKNRFPGNELGPLFKAALKALLEKADVERQREGRKRAALPGRRRVPKWVRRTVRKRDGGRCAFVASDGRRCEERSWLEYDHVVPFALGGRSDDPENIRLLCRGHNQQVARAIFGERIVGRGASSSPGAPPN